MTAIPRSIDEIDAAWLSNATGQRITGLRAEQIGVGIGVASSVYRLWLTGDGVPATMAMKLKALNETAAFTATVLRMYEREVKFFSRLAHRTPIRGRAPGESRPPSVRRETPALIPRIGAEFDTIDASW